jgi:hypothetical protein
MPRKKTKAQLAKEAADRKNLYGYKGLSVGTIASPRIYTGDRTKPGPFSDLYSMYENLGEEIFGPPTSRDRLSQAIAQNIESPIRASSPAYRSVYGTVEEQLSSYRAFEADYRLALRTELKEGVALSAGRIKQIEAGLSEYAPIDLSLISSLQARSQLREIFNTRVIKTKPLIENLGLPGLYTPSGNPGRLTSRYMASTADGYEPIIDILQGATFSIDPNATTLSNISPQASFRMGMQSLPPSISLTQRVARGGRLSLSDLPDDAILHSLDIEAEDVTPDALMRSVSAGTSRLSKYSDGSVKIRKVSGIENQELGAALITPRMKGLPSTDPAGLDRVMDFSSATAIREALVGLPGTDKKFDITTKTGRVQAADHFRGMLRTFNQSGHYLVTTFGESYDIPKMAQTFRAMEEFSAEGGEELLKEFERKMASGGMIDTLGLVKERLNNRIVDRLSAATTTTEQKALLAFQGLLSPSAMHRTRVAGEAVSPFGLGNLIQSTNFLQLLAEKGDSELIETLATSQGAHIASVDKDISLKVLEHLEELDIADPISGLDLSGLAPEMQRLIVRAQRRQRGSSAVTVTTNIADVRTLTNSVFDNLTQTGAIKRVQIDIDAAATEGIDPALSGLTGTIKFDPSSRSFRLYSGPEATPSALPSGFNAEEYIRRTLKDERRLRIGQRLGDNQSMVISTGINPIDAGNIQSINTLVTDAATSRSRPLIDAVTPQINDTNEAQFISGMSSTKTNIGYPYMSDTEGVSSSITGLMRDQLTGVDLNAANSYMKSLRDAGVGSIGINPEVRSLMVGLSEMTASQGARNRTLIASALGVAREDTRVSVLSERLSDTMKYFSELGIFHAGTQKQLVTTDSVLLLPTSILKDMTTYTSSGKKVKLLDPEALKLKSHSVRLSRATRATEELETVNFIMGGEIARGTGPLAQKQAREEATSAYQAIHNMLQAGGNTPKAAIDAGLAIGDEQTLSILGEFGGAPGTDAAKAKIESMTQTIIRHGFGGAAAEPGEASRGIAQLLSVAGEGADADTIASGKGVAYSIANVSEEGVTLVPRVSEAALREADRVRRTPGIASDALEAATDIKTRASATSQLGMLQAGIRRADQSQGFLDRLKTAYDSSSSATNIDLLNRLKVIKPRVYKSVGAVAALSAGYYLARRKAKSDPIDEVMEQQPLEQEGPMSISDFNRADQALARQTSSRRDPLVTAGVVGNLDRNKIGHTQMGANKYNHLYGA